MIRLLRRVRSLRRCGTPNGRGFRKGFVGLIVAGWAAAAPLWAETPRTALRIATYNMGNFFDTVNHAGIQDLVLTPAAFAQKLDALSQVILDLRPDALALCEVENREVVEALLHTPRLAELPYRIVHYDSPDPRGIDVAVIYRADRLAYRSGEPIAAPHGYRTRDVLRVEFDELTLYALHLPSRRGNNPQAARAREAILQQVGTAVRNELAAEPQRRIVVLGDFNENASSKLLRQTLPELHPATLAPFRQGKGSYAYRDMWLMYDNLLVSQALGTPTAQIFAPTYLLTPQGRFRGYPNRAYSDHLPAHLVFETSGD